MACILLRSKQSTVITRANSVPDIMMLCMSTCVENKIFPIEICAEKNGEEGTGGELLLKIKSRHVFVMTAYGDGIRE